MKVYVKGKGEVSLTQANFVAQGGQASVYAKNGTAYKVYTEPKNAIPEAKFTELSAIADPHVIKPDCLLVQPKGATPVGYTMQFLQDTYTLCQLFPRAFRERNGIDHDRARKLVESLQERVASVHRAGVLVVDLNELNILTDRAFSALYMIDVDSYQTRSYRAEVIMPSVRDWSVSAAQFSELSDWFSFAVLACQLYIGIHPYRGTHAKSNDVPKEKRLEHRMRNRLSVFGADVSIPKACYPFDVIPQHQREWLRAVLQDGKRLPPPDPRGVAPVILAPRVAAPHFVSGTLIITECGKFEGTVLALAESGGSRLVLTDAGLFLDGRMVRKGLPGGTTVIGFSPKLSRPFALTLHQGRLSVFDAVAKADSEIALSASEIARSDDRFYARTKTQVWELEIVDISRWSATTTSQLTVRTSHPVANVLESASRLYEGTAIQNMIGSTFVSLFPRSRAGYQVRMPELDRYRVIEAKFDAGVLMVLGAKDGQYDRLVFRFDESFASYDTRVVDNVTPAALNFVVANKVCVSLTEDEKIEAFGAKKAVASLRIAEDPGLGSDMRLMRVGGRVGFARGERLFTIGLK